MSSFRSRLTIAFALVAVLPLALALALFGRRLQRTVDEETDARLATTLAGLCAQFEGDAERLEARLGLLAADPQLKRLVLVPANGAAELRQYLADQRFLLGLDGLWVADTAGTVLADGALAATLRAGEPREPLPATALPARGAPGAALASTREGLLLEAGGDVRYQGRPAARVRGGVRLDSLWLVRLKRVSGVELVLLDTSGRALAATLAGALAGPLPAEDSARARRVTVGAHRYRMLGTPLALATGDRARLVALAPTAAAEATLAALGRTVLLIGLGGVLLALALGAWSSLRLARPVEQLADFSERVARGEWDEPLALEGARELEQLIDALERMRRDLRRYRDGLRANERQAAYGQMARQVAHEIKNPLTPIAVSMSDLKRSWELQRPDFGAILDQSVRTVSDEVERLKRLLADFNELGRFPAPRKAPLTTDTLAGDVRDLYRHELESGRLRVASEDGARLFADRDQLRQALVNLVQNALEAVAGGPGHVTLTVRARPGAAELTVADEGPGLSSEQRAQLFVPGFTTKHGGSGIGLTLVERIVTDHGGTIEVQTAPGRGTTFVLRFPTPNEA